MKMTLPLRDIKAIERGLKKYNTDIDGFLTIVDNWLEQVKSEKGTKEYEALEYFKECVVTYKQWHS
jgi:CRISPR/Cas system CSM-associated protein Csm2 small subunit